MYDRDRLIVAIYYIVQVVGCMGIIIGLACQLYDKVFVTQIVKSRRICV